MGNVSGWVEGILLVLAFVAILSLVVGELNHTYSKDNNVGFSDNSTDLFVEYQSTAESQIKGGDVEFDADNGISLKSSYGLTVDAINIVWSFLSGGFIEEAITSWNAGTAGTILAKAIRILWFLSLVFALLYALFKIKI